MKRFISGLFVATGAAVFVVGVLAAVEVLLGSPERRRRTPPTIAPVSAPEVSEPEMLPESVAMPATPVAVMRNFNIKRTKSEVGYVYWILEGFGRHKCFILCDSWEEAIEQARVKSAEVAATLVSI